MFSGFRSVWVSLFLCRTEKHHKQHLVTITTPGISCVHTGAVLTSHSSDYLVRHVPDVIDGKRLEVVLFEEIIGAEAQQLKGNANVAVVVEPVQHVNTSTEERKDTIY